MIQNLNFNLNLKSLSNNYNNVTVNFCDKMLLFFLL